LGTDSKALRILNLRTSERHAGQKLGVSRVGPDARCRKYGKYFPYRKYNPNFLITIFVA
jgi:hypothetical protein